MNWVLGIAVWVFCEPGNIGGRSLGQPACDVNNIDVPNMIGDDMGSSQIPDPAHTDKVKILFPQAVCLVVE